MKLSPQMIGSSGDTTLMHKLCKAVMGSTCWVLVMTAQIASRLQAADADTGEIPIIPAPKRVVFIPGQMPLGPQIVADDPRLRPLAVVVQQELQQLTGASLRVADGTPGLGDIILRIDPSLDAETYAAEVNEMATVRGGNAAAVAFGTVSLLQSVRLNEGRATMPHVRFEDEPFASYRGLLVDVARHWHSLGALKQIVELCRWYKIRQLQLHLTDDQSFTFPSTAFPKLATPNRHYTLEELRSLVTFAKDRGVEIVPELETPGHASAMVQTLPEVFANDPSLGNVLCPSRDETYRGLDTLIGEMADVFRSTPWFHIGADEVGMDAWKKCKDCQAYMAANHLDDIDELYRHFIVKMDGIVKKHGKKTIVWEGFHKEGKTEIPKDVTVMVFESLYNIAPDVLQAGYSVINSSWKPLYVVNQRNWTPEYIYGWNMYRWENWWDQSKAFKQPILVAPTPKVIGAEMCAWEQSESVELPSLRLRLAALSERLWNPNAARTYQDFAARLNQLDPMLTKLLPPN